MFFGKPKKKQDKDEPQACPAGYVAEQRKESNFKYDFNQERKSEKAVTSSSSSSTAASSSAQQKKVQEAKFQDDELPGRFINQPKRDDTPGHRQLQVAGSHHEEKLLCNEQKLVFNEEPASFSGFKSQPKEDLSGSADPLLEYKSHTKEVKKGATKPHQVRKEERWGSHTQSTSSLCQPKDM